MRLDCLIATVAFNALLVSLAWAADTSGIPNFAPDSVTGWIAGDPDGGEHSQPSLPGALLVMRSG